MQKIISAFKTANLDVAFEKNYFIIINSNNLSNKINEKVQSILQDLSFCYIGSENRIRGRIIFSITPLVKPAEFELWEFKQVVLTKKKFWNSIKSCPFQVEDPAFALELQNKLSSCCGVVNSLMFNYFESDGQGRFALDMGCGVGTNSHRLLDINWDVTAIDRNKTALEKYKIFNPNHRNLTLIHADLNQIELPKNHYHLVIALQLLNYFKPDDMIALIKKIHSTLTPGGEFVGTLWIEQEDKSYASAFNNLGVAVYKKEMVPALLEYSGFEIIHCNPGFEAGSDLSNFNTLQFIAKKIAKNFLHNALIPSSVLMKPL